MTHTAVATARRTVDRFAAALIGSWLVLYGWRTLVGHYSLATNAFDLSVFDYALWSLAQGERGTVPFMGHSIFSHHFMPVLALIAPVYSLFESPVFLLVLQLIVAAAAGAIYFILQRRMGVGRMTALALLAVFLFSRRTHSAVAGSFYPECLQALLTFAVIATWTRGGWAYWLSALALLMTKEDAAIYLSAAATAAFFTPYRDVRRTVVTLAVALCWFVPAIVVAIPASRAADGLPRANPLIETRFGSPEGQLEPALLADRVASTSAGRHAVNLIAATGGLSLLGAIWLVPALPGIVINLAASPDSMQATLGGYYAWPILPWLFMAAAAGVTRLERRLPRLALAWVLVLVAVTIIDNPAIQRMHRTTVDPDARAVRSQLAGVRGTVIVAQPNLIPHLPHQTVFAFGGSAVPGQPRPDLVLLTEVGNLWPLTRDDVAAAIHRYEGDAAYQRVSGGPLHAFALRK